MKINVDNVVQRAQSSSQLEKLRTAMSWSNANASRGVRVHEVVACVHLERLAKVHLDLIPVG